MNIPSKENILTWCKNILLHRIETAEQAMKAAQESSNSEDKSSAGDKYETARAMGQLDRNMNAKQLHQAQQELKELQRIDNQPTTIVQTGSVIVCETTTYFIAIGIGPTLIENQQIIILSPKSPLGKALWGKKQGDLVLFNQQKLSIKAVL